MKVIVVGGGAAGMLAAYSSAKSGNKVILIEKNNILGRKMLITGKGRCNITSSIDIDDFIKNIPGNGKFLYSSFQNFTNKDIIELLNKNNLKVKEERGNRIFPITDKAQSVVDALVNELKKHDIDIRLNKNVIEIITEDNVVKGVKLENGEIINASKIVFATGGKSYPLTGSSGEGYKIIKKLGHTIIQPRGSLVPLVAEPQICQELQGLSLKNVKILIKDIEKNKKIYDDFGEMLFTHFGLSGPIILSSSAHLLRYNNFKENNIRIFIDLKPALDEETLNSRIIRDFEEFKNKDFKNSLDKLLPQKLIPVIIELSGISADKKVNEITREERFKLVHLIKNFEIVITGFRPVQEAIITAGGVSTKEINPKTMESKIISGLFFAGEIIDVDAYTGGFNLQIAYSTGFTAGM